MSQTRVVHCRKEKYDVYIGRSKQKALHYGNPFSHHIESCAQVLVQSREEAVLAFRSWLEGYFKPEVDPARRLWILAHLKELKGKTLGCWCKPLDCHGDVLKELADGTD